MALPQGHWQGACGAALGQGQGHEGRLASGFALAEGGNPLRAPLEVPDEPGAEEEACLASQHLLEVQSQGGAQGLLGEAPDGRGLAGEPSGDTQGHRMPLVALGLLGDALVLGLPTGALPTAAEGPVALIDASLGHVTGPAAPGWDPCDWGGGVTLTLLSLEADLPETLAWLRFVLQEQPLGHLCFPDPALMVELPPETVLKGQLAAAA